jgi:D-amino-acid oxidase
MDALIIGAGVSGLTTGICLAEAGLKVAIRAAVPPESTTSVAAGALWGPVFVGPEDRAMAWAQTSLEVLTKLATEPGTGVRMVSGKEVTRTEPEFPYWSHLLPSMRLCEPDELPPGFAGGWHYTAPLATMPVYLDYLRNRFTQAGGTIEISAVRSLSELAGGPGQSGAAAGGPGQSGAAAGGPGQSGTAAVVVNCAGIGARDLVPDPAVYPVRGQVAIAENPGIEEFLISRDEPRPGAVYMFPHGPEILLGGTIEENEWDLTPDPHINERIVAGALRIEPRLRGARILAQRVGLRPCRPEVRLESEPFGDGVLWHNYGHGGAGISLSWGCAAEIAAAVAA